MDGRKVDICIFSGLMYDYVISVVDLKDSQEVFILTGRDCATTIEKKFKNTLQTSLSFN